MSDHADIVREWITHASEVHSGADDAVAALDALVAERDEQRSLSHEHYEAYVSEVALRQAAEAERDAWRILAEGEYDRARTEAAEAEVARAALAGKEGT